MASTYSTNLKIELMGTGENSGTWGTITNTNLGTAFEQAVIGLGNPDYTSDANLTITLTNTNASQAARALVLNVTSAFGSLTATRELIVPTIQKQYIVQNNTTGGQSITVKTSAGTGITVPNGRKAHLYVDGTNVIQMFDFVDINGGAIDGATVGAASASTGAFTSLTASGATTLNGAVALGDASGDLITVPGTVNSNLLFTDATYDIGASGATRPRDMFLSRNLTVGGTLTLAGGVNLNGNVTVGDSSADTLTINSTITSNLIFTDNTYDIGASGATRPRNLFLAGNATIGGAQTLTGALTVDSTTDSSSTTTGSIQTDGGVGIAKALYVGTTANIAGAVTLSGGTANGVLYLNGSKVATSGSALTFDGTNLGVGVAISGTRRVNILSGAGITPLAAVGPNGYLLIDNTGAGENYYSASSAQIWVSSATELMRLTGTGLGIGIAAPTVKLDIVGTASQITNGAGASGSRIRFETPASSGGSYVQMYKDLTPSYVAAIGTVLPGGSAVSAMVFSDYQGSWVERMRITSAGDVGIGISSPVSRVDARAASAIIGNYQTIQAFSTDTSAAIDLGGGIGLGGFYNSTQIATFGTIVGRKANGTTGNYDGYLAFGTNAQATGVVEHMRLSSGGSLNIGTTSSDAKLVASGGNATTGIVARFVNPSSGANAKIGFSDTLTYNWTAGATGADFTFINGEYGTVAGTERVRITSAGNVGIGTNNPTLYGKLTVRGGITVTAGSTSLTGTSFSTSDASNSTLWVNHASAVTNLVTDAPLAFWTASGAGVAERMRITSAGYVGIATNNPTAGFANYQTTSQLSSGNTNGSGVWTVTNTTAASNNATTDVLRLQRADGTLFTGYVSGHVYIVANGASGGNGFSAMYELNTTSNGITDATFTQESLVARGTNPVSSITFADDGAGGAVKVQVTWINNSGVVTGGSCNASFVGFGS